MGHRSQTAARAAQLGAVSCNPICRRRDEAALAIAREIDRKDVGRQPKQAMHLLSDERPDFEHNQQACSTAPAADDIGLRRGHPPRIEQTIQLIERQDLLFFGDLPDGFTGF